MRGVTPVASILLPALFWIAAGWALPEQPGNVLRSVRHSAESDQLRLLLLMDRRVPVEGRRLERPSRLYFDLPDTVLAAGISPFVELESPLARRLRVGQFRPHVARVVLELKEEVEYEFRWLEDPLRLLVLVQSAAAEPAPGPPAAEPRGEAVLSGVDYRMERDWLEVDLRIDRQVVLGTGRLSNPERFYLDLQGCIVAADFELRRLRPANRYVRLIRWAQFRAGVVRVVFDLEEARFFRWEWLEEGVLRVFLARRQEVFDEPSPPAAGPSSPLENPPPPDPLPMSPSPTPDRSADPFPRPLPTEAGFPSPPGPAGEVAKNPDLPPWQVLDEVVARVNSAVITLSDLRREEGNLRRQLAEEFSDESRREQAFQGRRQHLLRELIERELIVQRAEETGLGAQLTGELEEYLNAIWREAGFSSLESFGSYLHAQGSSLQEYRELARRKLLTERLLYQEVYSRIVLFQREIEEYYRQNGQRFGRPGQVELAEIYLPARNAEERRQMAARKKEVHRRLLEGMDFGEAARRYSRAVTASQGGYLGWFPEGSLHPALEEAVTLRGEGEITDWVEMEDGFYLLKVLSRRPPSLRPLEEVRDLVEEELYRQKAAPRLQEFLEGLVEESYLYVSPPYRTRFALSWLEPYLDR